MRVLIGCEFSQIVTKAFRDKGHIAYSCDVLDTEGNPNWHYKCDICDILDLNWDLAIFHPPCTHLAVSGARWFHKKQKEIKKAVEFFMCLVESPISKWCIENPVSVMSTLYRKPDQYIQPWQFGHGETKKTCLWLKELPLLQSTNIVSGREPRIHKMPPSKDRGKVRSITYMGIANAMAIQWGN